MPLDDLLILSIRTLILVVAPIVVVVSLAGTLVSALQSVTSVHEPAISFAVRLAALVATLYVLFPFISQSILTLAQAVFR